MHVSFPIRGDQIGRFRRLTVAGAITTLHGVRAFGAPDQSYVVEIAAARMVTGATLRLVGPDGAEIVAPVAAGAGRLGALATGDGHVILEDARLVIDLDGVPHAPTARHYGPSGEIEARTDYPGIAHGSLIETPDGPRRIEALVPGDRVITRDSGMRRVVWTHSYVPGVAPVLIPAEALGPQRPRAWLGLAPGQRVLVSGRPMRAPEVLALAEGMMSLPGVGAGDADVPCTALLLDGHGVLMANGAPVESLYPDAAALRGLGGAATDALSVILPELTREPVSVAYPAARPRLSLSETGALLARIAAVRAGGRLRTARSARDGRITSFTDSDFLAARPVSSRLN